MERELRVIAEKSLECLVCLDFIRPPIILCTTGHTICGTCKLKVANCEICKSEWSNTRCFALEKFADAFKYKCMYSKAGCKKEEFLSDVMEHEKICEFIDRPCPLQKQHYCNWNGPVCKIEAHLIETNDKIFEEHSYSMPFKWKKNRHCTIKADNELFLCTFSLSILDPKITTWCFEHISAIPYKEPIYKVELKFENQINDGNQLTIIRSVQNWLNIENQIQVVGVNLSDDLLLPFVKKRQIKYSVHFRKL